MTDVNTNNDEKADRYENADLYENEKDGANADAEDLELDDSKAKFLNGGKGLDDTTVAVEVSSGDVSFTGLGKEELMRYANDPFWKKVRLGLFILFWIGWVAMLAAAIIIIVLAPRCPERPDQKWYNKELIYQVLPKSFQDTTTEEGLGAGVGDLKGIENRMGYLESIGAKVLWFSSMYQSAKGYDGSDVVDYTKLDPVYGTLDQFKQILRKMHKKGMKVVMDFIPNHTSKNHTWFNMSQAKDGIYTDFYVWADGRNNGNDPPNNWLSIRGGPAWTKDPVRKQWYLHQFSEDLPDLNLKNDQVLEELESALHFWLGVGIDGFHIADAAYLIENNVTQDEPRGTGTDPFQYNYNDHIYTAHQPESIELLQRWRAILDSKSDKPGREKMMFVTLKNATVNQTLSYYGHGMPAADIVPSPAFITDLDCGQKLSLCINDIVKDGLNGLADGINFDGSSWRGWMLGNSESKRLASRLVSPDADIKKLQALQLLLPGTAFNYYGDEIGMKDVAFTMGELKDTVVPSRDPHRTPMLWDSNANAGFCDESFAPWLKISPSYKSENVQFQTAHLGDYSILDSFSDLAKLRTSESFQWGRIKHGVIDDAIFWFTRKADGFPGFLVAMNNEVHGSAHTFSELGIKEAEVVYHSSEKDYKGKKINLADAPVRLAANDVLVLKYM